MRKVLNLKSGEIESGDTLTDDNIDELLSNLTSDLSIEEIIKRRESGEKGFLSDEEIDDLLS